MTSTLRPDENTSVILQFADGQSWSITAEDDASRPIVTTLKTLMQLGSSTRAQRQLLLTTVPQTGQTPSRTQIEATNWLDEQKTVLKVTVTPATDEYRRVDLCRRMVSLISRDCERQGGLLVHGALATKETTAIILAGPSEVGKSTACQRLPEPWLPLSDDTTQIVRNATSDSYWAHPWPTWGRFMFDGPGGSWKFNHSTHLSAIFFLVQAVETKVLPVQPGEAACLLNECIEQVGAQDINGLPPEMRRSCRLQRFDNISKLVREIPCFILRLSLKGAFWHHIDTALQQLPEA